jgi:hypothetical protein
LIYDVINSQGALVDRVQIPAGRTIVGFGKGGVAYMVARDKTGHGSSARTGNRWTGGPVDCGPGYRSCEQPHLPARVPKQDCLIRGKALVAHVGNQRAERFRRVGVVHEQRFGPRRERLRFARRVRRYSVAVADPRIVDLDVTVERFESSNAAHDRAYPDRIASAESSALTAITRV